MVNLKDCICDFQTILAEIWPEKNKNALTIQAPF